MKQKRKTGEGTTRRDFLALGAVAGLGAFIGLQREPEAVRDLHTPLINENLTGDLLNIHPRYHRWFVDPGVEWLEANTGYATLNWKIPLSQSAIVLVDVWQRHYLRDTEERAEKIINSRLLPLLSECRKAGMNIIHAPSPEVAKLHPDWVRLQTEKEMMPERADWPPEEFLNRTGPFKPFAMPFEPREEERNNLPALTFHPKVVPVNGEPVVATGEELHRYCRKKGILFLLFAGFNTNACILVRDYGTIQMRNRGYAVILIRDCTTGMESKDTHASLSQTNGAILFLEMFGHFSVTSEDIIQGLTGKT